MRLNMVVAADITDSIGRGNELPWSIPSDLRYFKGLTTGHTVLVGRKTHDSIRQRLGRSLPDRTTVVLSSQEHDDEDNVKYRTTLEAAIVQARAQEVIRSGTEVYVIGGLAIYTEMLPLIDRVYLTRVAAYDRGEVKLPQGWLKPFRLIHVRGEAGYDPLPGDQFRCHYYVYDRRH